MRVKLNISGSRITDAMLRLASEDVKPALEDALTRAGDVMVTRLQESADAHHGGGTGRMHDAIRARKPSVNVAAGSGLINVALDDKLVWTRGGVTRRGNKRKGIERKGSLKKTWSMQDQGAELNYGSSRVDASRWFDEGVEKAEDEVFDIIRETLDEWIAASVRGA